MNSEEKRGYKLKLFRNLLQLLGKENRARIIGMLSIMILGAGLEIAGVGSIVPFLGVAGNPQIIQTQPILSAIYTFFKFDSTQSFLITLGVLVIVLTVLSNGVKAWVHFALVRFTRKRRFELSTAMMNQILQQPYLFFLNSNPAELMKNVIEEVNATINGLLMPILSAISKGVIVVGLITFLVVTDPLLAISVAVFFTAVYVILFRLAKKPLHLLGKKRVEATRVRTRILMESLLGIKDVKVLGRESFFSQVFSDASYYLVEADAKNDLIANLPKYILETLAFGGVLGLIMYMIVVNGDFQAAAPMIGLYVVAGYRMLPQFQQLFADMAKAKFNRPSLELLLNSIKRLKTSEALKKMPVRVEKKLHMKNQIRVVDLSYRYPNRENYVFQGLNLQIKVNTTVGFVGSSGGGKTTLVDLILGLLDPVNGNIVVDDTPITDLNKPEWMNNIGYVPQAIYLADRSIAENIAFGLSKNEIELDKVKAAARMAHLEDFIETELPQQWDTLVGDRGIRLSGGQRQRIGIARALYRDPEVLIFDEATSALDGLTEKAIMEALEELTGKKTILLIAHRLTTLTRCDNIYFLDKGEIKHQGTYESLMNTVDEFKKLAGKQSSDSGEES